MCVMKNVAQIVANECEVEVKLLWSRSSAPKPSPEAYPGVIGGGGCRQMDRELVPALPPLHHRPPTPPEKPWRTRSTTSG